MKVNKCQICGGSLTERDLCPECEERIGKLRKAINNAKLRISQAKPIQKEVIETEKQGILRLKKDYGGYRHYIELQNGYEDDIHCGDMLEVQLGRYDEDDDWGKMEPGPWIRGRYEANLCSDIPKVQFILGEFYPYIGIAGDSMVCQLPLGVMIRRPKK